MRFYLGTFIVAFVVIAVAVGFAFLPEMGDILRRYRGVRSERHLIKREKDTGPRPPRPDLKRERADPETDAASR
jgi:hypothetical protein